MHTPVPPLLSLLALVFFSLSLPLVRCLSHLDSGGAPPRRLHLRAASDFPNNTYIDRSFFPSNFTFGTYSLAYKHEGYGSIDESQKADSIWDIHALKTGATLDGTMPRDAGDQYDRYEEDLELVEQMRMDAYRFSIAWSRIFPNGTGADITPNAEAIAHYNALIDLLLKKGIKPHATLWAQDHPQYLEEEYGGLLSTRFIDDFVIYANACFIAFGDRVKYWITLDEPNDYASMAYASTQNPPGRCSSNEVSYLVLQCTVGNSTTEPYIVAHNLLLAHSAVAHLYKHKYQEEQKGIIGIALWLRWYEPYNSTDINDIDASQRAQDFHFGWFMDVLAFGKYPESMRSMLGPRLPSFSSVEAAELQSSWDFVGLAIVVASYVIDTSNAYQDTERGYFTDMRLNTTGDGLDGITIDEGSDDFEVWLPWCVRNDLAYMRERYNNPPMYITEAGWGISYTSDLQENLNDSLRVKYYHSYYATLSEQIRRELTRHKHLDVSRDGADVRGFFAWSLIDGYEPFLGMYLKFGAVYVDENMERYPRMSAFWHQMVNTNNFTQLAISTQSPHTSRAALK